MKWGYKMKCKEWSKSLEDGRKAKFTCDVLQEGVAFVAAQVAGNPVVYSVLLSKANSPLSSEDVESHFAAELKKK